jgi:hypothetical protein
MYEKEIRISLNSELSWLADYRRCMKMRLIPATEINNMIPSKKRN